MYGWPDQLKTGPDFSRVRAQFENVRAVLGARLQFWTDANFSKVLPAGGDHNEFAMCMFAPGGAIDAACAAHPDGHSRTAEGRQRQSSGLAVFAVSARLVRDELIELRSKTLRKSATPRKRNI